MAHRGLLDRRRWLPALMVCGSVWSGGSVRAQTLAASARQMSPGSLKLSVFYQGTQGQTLNFNITGNGTCTGGSSAPSSNVTFPCGASGNVPATADGGMVVFKAMYQPWDSLQYYASVGVGDLTLRVSSVSATNVLTGDRPGYQYTLGTRVVLIPDTVAGPGIAIDGQIGWQRFYFNASQPAVSAASAQVDQRLDLYQYQVAIETSHRFDFGNPRWSVEPYGGVKWLRTQADLKDLGQGGHVGGAQDTFTPFVGVVVPIYEHEALVGEGSFVNGYQYSLGLQIRL